MEITELADQEEQIDWRYLCTNVDKMTRRDKALNNWNIVVENLRDHIKLEFLRKLREGATIHRSKLFKRIRNHGRRFTIDMCTCDLRKMTRTLPVTKRCLKVEKSIVLVMRKVYFQEVFKPVSTSTWQKSRQSPCICSHTVSKL